MAVVIAHEFWPSNNPRLNGKCACGHAREEHPQPTADTCRRNIDFEREITREAARGVVDPTPLIEFSEARCNRLSGEYVSDPSRRRANIDLRESREEAADLRWYLACWLEDNPEHEKRQDIFLALRHLTLLYDLLLDD